jgi:hypothetical protein
MRTNELLTLIFLVGDCIKFHYQNTYPMNNKQIYNFTKNLVLTCPKTALGNNLSKKCAG